MIHDVINEEGVVELKCLCDGRWRGNLGWEFDLLKRYPDLLQGHRLHLIIRFRFVFAKKMFDENGYSRWLSLVQLNNQDSKVKRTLLGGLVGDVQRRREILHLQAARLLPPVQERESLHFGDAGLASMSLQKGLRAQREPAE